MNDVGTTNDNQLVQLYKSVRAYLEMKNADRMQRAATKSALQNLTKFTENLANVLEKPCGSELPEVSRFDFVMDYFKSEVSLDIQLPMRSVRNPGVVER